MKRILVIIFICFFVSLPFNLSAQGEKEFLSGADMLIKGELSRLKGKKIGIITNHTGILKNGTHIADTLSRIKGIKVISLFSPEHGIRGNYEAGAGIDNSTDAKTGIKVISIYGRNYKIQKEYLKELDILLFDIQDIGARYYTYISTLYYAMESCAENRVPLIVLDRPNPIAPVKTDGPLTEKKFQSFIGIAPLPVIHGMTIGEIARFFNYLFTKEKKPACKLSVIKMRNYNRKKFLDSYSSIWIKPSPNMSSLETAIAYPGTCLIEGTNVSEGRGTKEPFLLIGAPFINSASLINELKQQGTREIELEPAEFTPADIPGMATNPKYENETCRGIRIKITDRTSFEPLKFGVKLIYALHKLFPEFKFLPGTIDKLWGSEGVRTSIEKGDNPEKIFNNWNKELNNFINLKKKFLLYI